VERESWLFPADIEQRSLDLRFGLRGSRQRSADLIVGIDERLTGDRLVSAARSSYALLIRKLKEDGARVMPST